MLLTLQNRDIDREIATNQKVVLQYLINDIEKFDSNSNVLSVLFRLVEVISKQSVEPLLTIALYQEFNMLSILTTRLSLSEYRKRPNERKDIYAYIHTLVHTIKSLVSDTEAVARGEGAPATMASIITSQETYWNALEAATQQDMALSGKKVEWGKLEYVNKVDKVYNE